VARAFNLNLATATDWVRGALYVGRQGWDLATVDDAPRVLSSMDRSRLVASLRRCADEWRPLDRGGRDGRAARDRGGLEVTPPGYVADEPNGDVSHRDWWRCRRPTATHCPRPKEGESEPLRRFDNQRRPPARAAKAGRPHLGHSAISDWQEQLVPPQHLANDQFIHNHIHPERLRAHTTRRWWAARSFTRPRWRFVAAGWMLAMSVQNDLPSQVGDAAQMWVDCAEVSESG
jgi:hypothetical protein